ncbi:hypothetical protein C7448_11115 [Tenacibaculum gallaicum]|uniref:Uncharacterized protein n=1 Tax=Tenacibaculum gallaicum TaxID=561505 RepID=A0A3E0HFF2_9FLAO|nr:hypothetical protein [Tenacibaculum gallaicum]REH44483.1 hypothetical protein C7448_11115 [Tenacibaculum gallaicum]
MKFIDYILKFSFGIALGVVLVFKGSPKLFKQAKELKNETLKEEKLDFFTLECLTPNDYSYLRLRIGFSNGIDIKQIYDVSENTSYSNLINLLETKNIVNSRDLEMELPINLTVNDLRKLEKVEVKFNKKNDDIEKLVIDSIYIIGSEPSIIRICLIYFLGGVIFILGLSSLIVTLIMLFKNLNIYNKTDKLPELPNTIESKIKGLKFLAKWFRKK